MESDAAWDCKRRRRQRGDDDDSGASKKRAVGSVASPVAHLSCARIRPFVHASRPKKATKVTTGGDVTLKEKTGERICCKKIEPASRPKNSARTVAHGVITKQKASEKIPCTRIRPAVQASGIKDKAKAGSVGILRSDVIKTKQEASERVQAAAAKSIPPIQPPAPATMKNHQDPFAPQDSLRAALVAACQALDRRQQNVYRQQREAARRELDKVVQTVFFDDPHITLDGVLNSLEC
jgi:hypothetical protein